ncbi:hypothetical protein BH24CHL5_BH24CHL5_10030 [soil metagenome]
MNISQRRLAAELSRSPSRIWRLEHMVRLGDISFVEVAELASVLGLELSAGLHPLGDPIRDKGHVALLNRFRAVLSPDFRVVAEAPLPMPGDKRSWDLLLRIDSIVIGVEAETRLRDLQWLTRRIRERQRDGAVDHIILVLAESAINRRLLPDLAQMLGDEFATPPRSVLASLRAGRPPTGSGIVLL